jgi:hypothetical protein
MLPTHTHVSEVKTITECFVIAFCIVKYIIYIHVAPNI